MISNDENLAFSILGNYLIFYSLMELDPNMRDSYKSWCLEESKKIKDDRLRASLDNIVRSEQIKITTQGISLKYDINSN